MVPPPDETPKSLGDGVTGSDVEPPEDSSAQSVGDQSTTGDMGSSVSDLDALVGEFEDDQGEVIDLEARYEIESTLGIGGMGEVVLARDKRLNRKVAIKRLKEELGASRKAAQRFLTEAQSVAALNHFNIVQIHDYGRAADGPFIVMEYVGGGSLAETLEVGALELERTIELGCQLCEAIGVAHQAGIIHRDIKPANVLMTAEGVPKLTDFGLARQETVDGGQTQAGAVLGTLDFMPPEQKVDATKTDARSDLWSLGATLYQMVTGEIPRVIDLDEVPGTIRSVLARALKSKPEARFQTAEEFRDALRGVLAGGGPEASELGEGECPSCGVQNESSRKFCRNCAASLEVPCLSCETVMPMWEDVCGSCGSRQSELVAQRREKLQSQREEAESLQKSLEYAQAVAIAQALLEEPDPRFQQLNDWAKQFIEDVGREEEQQRERLGELVGEAEAHEQAHDYPAGIRTLEQVAEPLRDQSVTLSDGSTVNVTRLLARLQDAQETSERLDRTIRDRVKRRDLDGLLPDVTALLQLRPDLADLLKLQEQLAKRESRHQDRLQSRTKSRVSALIKEFRYQDALSLLSKLEESGQIRSEKLETWVQTTRERVNRTYKPRRSQYDEMEEEAKRAYEQGDFGRAVELITAIPAHERGSEARKIRVSAPKQSADRKQAATESTRNWLYGIVLASVVGGLLILGFRLLEPSSPPEDTWKADKRSAEEVAAKKVGDSQERERIAAEEVAAKQVTNRLERERIAAEKVAAKQVADRQERERIAAKRAAAKKTVEGQNPLTLKGHSIKVNSVSFSPDGKRIVSGGYRTVKVWDAATGQETLTLKGHSFAVPVLSVSFSPDGKRIVSGSEDKTVKVWDAQTGQEMLTLKGHSGDVNSVSFSPDGKLIVSGGGTGFRKPGEIKVWDAQTGQEVLPLEGHSQSVSSASFSPDGKRIVSGSSDGTVKVWDAATGQKMLTLKGHVASVNSVSFSPDGKRIVSGGGGSFGGTGEITVWDAETGKERLTLKGHSSVVSSESSSPDGKWIVSGSEDMTLKVWDAQTGQETLTLKGHSGSVWSVSFSPDGKRIVSGSGDKTIKIWDISSLATSK